MEVRSPAEGRRKRDALKLGVTLALTGLILGLLAWKLRPGLLLEAIGRLSPGTLTLAVGLALLLSAVQAAEMFRWSLRALGEVISVGQALVATVGGMAIKQTATPPITER